jgi:hypothetical protein
MFNLLRKELSLTRYVCFPKRRAGLPLRKERPRTTTSRTLCLLRNRCKYGGHLTFSQLHISSRRKSVILLKFKHITRLNKEYRFTVSSDSWRSFLGSSWHWELLHSSRTVLKYHCLGILKWKERHRSRIKIRSGLIFGTCTDKQLEWVTRIWKVGRSDGHLVRGVRHLGRSRWTCDTRHLARPGTLTCGQ